MATGPVAVHTATRPCLRRTAERAYGIATGNQTNRIRSRWNGSRKGGILPDPGEEEETPQSHRLRQGSFLAWPTNRLCGSFLPNPLSACSVTDCHPVSTLMHTSL